MTRRRWILSTAAVAGMALAALGAMKLTAPNGERPDCPGKIVCPLTGKLVCKDRCPLHKSSENDLAAKPSCCSKGKVGS